ncbi:hypothetical protein BKA70DRAFT_1405286 [Coprinopsis sp. MPI-PUGE-AT-0042]|nr:hypothetical protein BKA70DRAFT_1405286 [Coprinopsis sp. MPI-PUGE-AT-0042]
MSPPIGQVLEAINTKYESVGTSYLIVSEANIVVVPASDLLTSTAFSSGLRFDVLGIPIRSNYIVRLFCSSLPTVIVAETDSSLLMPSDLELPPPSLPHDPRKGVLSDEDLLDMIFGFIQADIDRSATLTSDNSTGYKPRRQLLNLALTCKALLEPALNALWYLLPTLVPLIRLIQRKSCFDETYCLRSVPDAANWAQIMSYGNRVRVLTFNSSPPFPPPHKVSSFLYQVVCLESRLPRLKEIYVTCGSQTDYDAVLASITSTLIKVDVVDVTDVLRDAQFVQHLLASLSRHSPGLEHLSIYGKGKGSVSLTGSPIIVSDLTRLTHLKIVIQDVLDNSNDLQALANLENLQCLTLYVGNPQPVHHQQTPIMLPATPYPALRRLKIVGTASNIRRSLSRISLSSIQSLILRFILSAKYFEAILAIKCLKRLTLDVSGLSATNEFIQAIATSLPNLISLILPPIPGDTHPDMGCLPLLANGCPNLVQLRMCLHLGQGMGGKLAVKGSPKHPLRSLSISDAGGVCGGGGGDATKIGVAETLAIARFLDGIFPHLQDLLTHRNSDGEGSGKAETMSDIAMLINVLREARVATSV